MRRARFRLVMDLLAITVAAPALRTHAAPLRVSAKSFALAEGDVPAGYRLISGKFQSLSNAAGSHLKVSVLKSHGYLQSYLVGFEKSGGRAIICTTYVFKTAAGAAWYDHFEVTTDARASGARPVAGPKLSDPSAAFTFSVKSSKRTVVFYLMTVRHGALYGGVAIGGPRGAAHLPDVAALAKRMQRKMDAAG